MTIRNWVKKRILVTVKSYPRPSSSHGETVCVAGITDDGQWIRLYPVTYRDLPKERQFAKYDWIEAEVTKSPGDHRPESYIVNHDTIRVLDKVGTVKGWEERRRLILPHLDVSIEALQASNRSLGFIKPASVVQFKLIPDAADWDPAKKSHLAQQTLFTQRQGLLEKVPWTFKYRFTCGDTSCTGHLFNVVDWEVFQAYRSWRREYRGRHIRQMKEKFERQLVVDKDLYFFVGTPLAQDRFRTFMIIGLFYPPRNTASVQLSFTI